MPLLETFIAADAKPTVDNYNRLNLGILPKGIYSGGAVSQGPGRQVTIEAFNAKALDGFTIVGETQNINIPPAPKQSWAVVLYAKSWLPGDQPKSHTVEFRVVPWVGSSSLAGYTDANPGPDFPYYILFAKVDALSNNVRILPTEIDTSFSDRVNLLNLCSTQLVIGSANFNGPAGSTVYHRLGHTMYKVQITPSEAPNVGIGDIWVVKDSRSFTVFSNGSVTTQFDWAVSTSQTSLGVDAQSSFGSRFGKGLLKDPVQIVHNENAPNYVLLASVLGMQEPLSLLPYVVQTDTVGTINGYSTVTSPICWQLVSGSTHQNMLFDSFIIGNNSYEDTYNQNIDASSLRVFIYPEASYSNPIITLYNQELTPGDPTSNRVKIKFEANVPDGTKCRRVIFKNPGSYPSGTTTGMNTIEVLHNLDLDMYVPFIAFTSITGGTLTGYNVEIGRKSFKVLLPPGVSASFDWLLVPSFTS